MADAHCGIQAANHCDEEQANDDAIAPTMKPAGGAIVLLHLKLPFLI